jgi:hypothetical protein
MNAKSLVNLILKGVATAMGVAVVVLSILGSATVETLVTLLGIGLFALSIWSFQNDGS